MKLLEERIKRDGVVKSEGVLKVDSFLNHQIDVNLIDEMGAEFARLFADAPVNKILTIEASGIGIAVAAALDRLAGERAGMPFRIKWSRVISATRPSCSRRRPSPST